MSHELFECEFKDLVEIDKQISTCDNNMMNWDRPAHEIMNDLNSVEQESVSDDEEEEQQSESTLSVNEIGEFFVKMRHYAVCKNQSTLLDMVMNFEDFFIQTRIEAAENQTKIGDFFKQ